MAHLNNFGDLATVFVRGQLFGAVVASWQTVYRHDPVEAVFIKLKPRFRNRCLLSHRRLRLVMT